MRGMRTGATPKNMKKTIGRIFQYMSEYRLHMALVVVCVILSAGASIASTYFLKPLINDYLLPYVGQQNPDLSGFISILCTMGVIYLIGVGATYA